MKQVLRNISIKCHGKHYLSPVHFHSKIKLKRFIEILFHLDRERSEKLGEVYPLNGIPTLVLLSSSLELITVNGVEEVQTAPEEALRKYSQGKSLFWSREAREDEFVWNDIKCNECFMCPLVGSRHGCPNRECHFNLCENCFKKASHEHEHEHEHQPLLEYFIPKKR